MKNKRQKVTNYIMAFIIIALALWVIFILFINPGVFQFPIFWIAVLGEFGLAILSIKYSGRWRLLLYFIALATPVFIGISIKGMLPITMLGLVYLMAFYSMLFIRERKSKIGSIMNINESIFNIILPNYLSNGYKEINRNIYKKKENIFVEIIFGSNESEHIIWIKESDGPILDIESQKKMQTLNKEIKGIIIRLDQEVIKPNSKRNLQKDPPFIDISWNHRNINFNLRSDGLSLGEAEKIIASMIQ